MHGTLLGGATAAVAGIWVGAESIGQSQDWLAAADAALVPCGADFAKAGNLQKFPGTHVTLKACALPFTTARRNLLSVALSQPSGPLRFGGTYPPIIQDRKATLGPRSNVSDFWFLLFFSTSLRAQHVTAFQVLHVACNRQLDRHVSHMPLRSRGSGLRECRVAARQCKEIEAGLCTHRAARQSLPGPEQLMQRQPFFRAVFQVGHVEQGLRRSALQEFL